jgi:penicillin V acylase-like amidase (Ntn superfamily)
MGLPADFTPPSRFVRGTVLLDNMIVPNNSTYARMQATEIIGAVATIGIDSLNAQMAERDPRRAAPMHHQNHTLR